MREISLEDSAAEPTGTGGVRRSGRVRETGSRKGSWSGKTASKTGKKRRKYACPDSDCKATFVSKYSVRRHQGDVHGPRVSCQYCGHSSVKDRVQAKPDWILRQILKSGLFFPFLLPVSFQFELCH